MKKKVLVALVVTMCMLTACAKQVDSPIIQDIEPETSTEIVPASASVEELTTEPEVIPENSYRSELTNEWIDNSLKDQRPIAVMVDNEKTALPHFGLTEADVVYEIMNSTANDRITRFMAIVKDWGSITQFGSIRSTRPTNFMLAVEWNAVICHDGGPFYINEWVARKYTNNFSGGFARFSNGKATEFTEYLTYDTYTNPTTGKSYDGLKQRFEKSNYSTTYNEYYQGAHFKFAEGGVDLSSRSDAINATTIKLPFTHNQSTLKYNEETKTYDYYEYGQAHVDPVHDNAPLTFTNVLLQDTTFAQLDKNGYLIYNAIDASDRSGYYITEGKAIEVTWNKPSETAFTVFYDKATGQEIELNTGKIYISLIPSDTWTNVEIQ
ncbi:MAG: DUF3048 domain-containing protein [Butyrivibrio sp.]|nr:DUF3048 domain-containing protein [Muribaculum sp.]MCM1551072.1 DUF3048 domain-containing protein [Butyrivibrio sp.]